MITIRNISLEDNNLDWGELISNSKTATFFQTKEWLQLWVKHWGKNLEVVIYAVFDNDELIGIAPFGVSNKIHILGAPDPLQSGSLSDFGDIIIKSGREMEVWEVILDKLNNETMKQWNNVKIELNFIREESPSFEILKGLGGKVEEIEVSPYINLPKTWDEYLLTLGRHDRHEIRRKIKKIEEENVIEVCDEVNTGNINDFFRLMAVSNEKKSDFLSFQMRAFLSEVIMQLGAKKQLALCFLRYEDVNIAVILLLFQRNEVLLYNSGFEPKYFYLSPGLILNIYAIKQAIKEGKSKFDFLRGGEKYKFDLGGRKRNLYKIKFD